MTENLTIELRGGPGGETVLSDADGNAVAAFADPRMADLFLAAQAACEAKSKCRAALGAWHDFIDGNGLSSKVWGKLAREDHPLYAAFAAAKDEERAAFERWEKTRY